jgi:Xaa-Pro aminopeptidase
MENRIANLRKYMKKENVDAMIVSNFANIYYYSNFSSEDGLLLITMKDAYLLTDGRYIAQSKEQCPNYKINIITKSYSATVKDLLSEIDVKRIGFEENLAFNRYKAFNDTLGLEMVGLNIESLKKVKDHQEIEKIKKACAIADKCYKHILKYVKVGMKEIEVRNEMLRYMLELGASKESFDIIVASGKRGAMPHGVASNKKIKEGDFVTLDFGCVNDFYCSDITRTFVMGEPSKAMLDIYEVVREAQLKGLEIIKPGIRAKDVDFACRDFIEKMGYGEYFNHSTGHGLGILVHDSLAISPNSDTVLKEGMVFTVEPGVYVEGLGGVRIEDDVVVTKDGCEILTKSSKKLYKIKA